MYTACPSCASLVAVHHPAAPIACCAGAADISQLVQEKIYDGTTFYRSDFVIQCGLHPKACPYENIKVNETASHVKVSNTRGTAAVAHWDV